MTSETSHGKVDSRDGCSSLLVGLFVMSARSATAPGTAGTTDKPKELELPNG